MSARELRHEPLELIVYVCLGCATQTWPGRDGLDRCQRTDRCGKPARVVVRADEAVQGHLYRAKREWEKIRHERYVALDERVAEEEGALVTPAADRLRKLADEAEDGWCAAYITDDGLAELLIGTVRWAADAADALAEIDASGEWPHEFSALLARLEQITGDGLA